jgi:hypothetical protein
MFNKKEVIVENTARPTVLRKKASGRKALPKRKEISRTSTRAPSTL